MKSSCLANAWWLGLLLLTVVVYGSFLSAKAALAGGGWSSDKKLDGSDVNSEPIVTNNHDGTQVLENMTERVKQLGAYKFDGYLGTIKEKDLKQDAGSFYYMPKSQLRVEVKSRGYKDGSILVKQKNGVIRAKGGPSLLGMKMNLEPDSNMLRLANGLNIIDCDYLSLLQWLKKQIAAGQKVYASDAPLSIQSQANRVLVLETRETGQPDGGFIAHRILIDPQQLVPLEWDIFKQGKFFSTVRFKNFQLCPSLDESLFQL